MKFLIRKNGAEYPFDDIDDVIKSRVDQLVLIKLKETIEVVFVRKLAAAEKMKLKFIFNADDISALNVDIVGPKEIISKLGM